MLKEDIVVVAAYTSLASIGLIGNLLVCVIIQKNRPVKRPINYLFLNLAISDTIVLLFLMMKYVFIHVYNHPSGVAGSVLCSVFTGGNFAWVGAVSSVLTMTFISFERYYIVLRPCRYLKMFKVANIRLAILLSWVFAVVFNVPLFAFGEFDEDMEQCTERWPSKEFSVIYACLWLVVVAVVPAVIVVVVYSQIIYTLWIKKKRTSTIIATTAIHKARKKVTKVVYIISLIYCVSWFPPLIDNIIIAFVPTRYLGDVTHRTMVFLIVLNSSVNPLVYTFQSARFRRHLRCLLFRRRDRNIVAPHVIETPQPAWVPPLTRDKSNNEPNKELNLAPQDLLFLWLTGP